MANNAKKLTKNFIYNLLHQIIDLIVPILLIPYLSRTLGADGIGTISYTESVTTYFLMFAKLGIDLYGQRQIAYVQHSKILTTKTFWNIKITNVLISTFIIAVYIPFSILQSNSNLYLIYLFHLLAVLIDTSWLYKGLEKFDIILLRNFIIKLLNVFFVLLFVRSHDDLLLYGFSLCFFTFVGNLLLWKDITKYIDRLDWKSLDLSEHIFGMFSMFIPVIATQIYTVMDKVMIGIITKTPSENGYYEQAVRTIRILQSTVTALGTVMIPKISYYFEQKDWNSIKKYIYNSYRFAWFLSIPICLGLISISDLFVPWFFGENFYPVTKLIKILAFSLIAIGISNVTGIQFLLPTQQQNIYTYSVIGGAFINFILNIFFIPHWQSLGAAIASLIAEIMIAILQLYFIRKEFNIIKIITLSKKYWIAGFIMYLLISTGCKMLPISLLSVLVLLISGILIYVLLLFFMRDDYICNTLSYIFHQKKK